MAEPFIAEIRIFSFNFPPKGWAFCNGQLLPIAQNQALFSLLGTVYGGDGRVTFGLPNLQARTPIHMGSGFTLGERGGETAHTLNIGELPTHIHFYQGSSDAAGLAPAANNVLGKCTVDSPFVGPAQPGTKVALNAGSITPSGGSQAHNNMQPYLTLNLCIALQGIFPSQT